MATRGRKPTPTAIKRARGNPGRRKLPEHEPQPLNIVQFPPRGGKPAAKKPTRRRAAPTGRKPKPRRKAPPEVWPPPDWLDEIGAAFYRRKRDEFYAMGVLTEVDLTELENYAYTYQKATECRAVLAVAGNFVKTQREGLKPHPALVELHKCTKDMRMYAEGFGGTPSARTRISVPPAGRDELEDYIGSR